MEPTTEQPIVTITTRIDYEAYKLYAKHMRLKSKAFASTVRSYAVFLPILAAAIVGLCLIVKTDYDLLGTILIGLTSGIWVVLLLFFLFMLYAHHKSLQGEMKFFKKYQRLHEADCVETFYEEYLTNHRELPEFIDDTLYRYEYYTQGVETETAFYLETAMDDQRHGIFPKKYMTEDQATALRALFTRKYGDKFKGMK